MTAPSAIAKPVDRPRTASTSGGEGVAPRAPSVCTREFAILCAGLDRVRRGYETHTRTLFDALNADRRHGLRFTLFKRAGDAAPNEIALGSPYRENPICRTLSLAKGDPLFWESTFFAIAFAVRTALTQKHFDKILVIEPVVAKVLHRLRFLMPGRPALLFTHGVCNEPEDYAAIADEIHEVNIENHRALELHLQGADFDRKHTLLPHFIEDDSNGDDRKALRRQFGITTPHVLLSVGAIEAGEKRMGFIIREAANLNEDWTLVLCGKVVDEALLLEARRHLGPRFVHLYVDRKEMNSVYRVADVFVSASLNEGFGIALLEAMRAGLPVVTHHRELYSWILKSHASCIDLTQTGSLTRFLNDNSLATLREIGRHNRSVFEECYTWPAVANRYYEMITR